MPRAADDRDGSAFDRSRDSPRARAAIEFRVSADEFLFDGHHGPAKAHLKSGKLLQRFEKIADLPTHEQDVVLYLLDAVIARAEFAQSLAGSAKKAS